MKIIIIPNEPNPNMTGRHYLISKALVSQGNEIHSIIWDLPYHMTKKQLVRHVFTSLFARQYQYEDITMHKIGRLPLFWPYINGWLFKYQIKKIYREIGADIIFSESYTNETIVPRKLPFIYDLADDYAAPADVYGSTVYKFGFKLLGVKKSMVKQCQRALAVTAVSKVLCNFAKQYSSNVINLPNGVDSETIKKVLQDKSTANKNEYALVYVTGFGPWSRPIETMQVVVELRKKYPKIELTLIGEGTEVPKINQFIKDNQAEGFIHYIGFVGDRKKLFSLINKSAIGLNISEKNKWRDAAHPIKVLEYSALRKKVVSSDLEGVKVLGFSNIFMFSGKRKSNLAKSIESALNTKLNKAATRNVSNHVQDVYNWQAIADTLSMLISREKHKLEAPIIVHVTPSYPPNLGGLEKVVQNLANIQKNQDLNVSVITAGASVSNNLATPDRFDVLRLKSFVLANTTIMPNLLLRLLALDREALIHLHITQAYTPEIVWIASKLKGTRYIAHIHLDVPPSGLAGFLLRIYKPLILKRVLRSAAYVVVFSNDQKTSICKKYGLNSTRVKVIPNGVESNFYYDKLRSIHKRPRLLFVGRLSFQKNLSQLLRALEDISNQFDTTLVGDGELDSELKRLVKKLKLNNVNFVGRADGQDLINYYKNSDIFVLTSEREGMPLVLLEAMAMGLPIVATDVMGTHDLVKDGLNGLLVPYDDVDAFRLALLKAKDADLYKNMSLASNKMSIQYSLDKVTAQFDRLYETAND